MSSLVGGALPNWANYCILLTRDQPSTRQRVNMSSVQITLLARYLAPVIYVIANLFATSTDKTKSHFSPSGNLHARRDPNAGYPQLRVCCDFMNYLFHFDNLSDDMDDRSTISVGNVVTNSLCYPNSRRSSARLGKMTRE